MPHPDPENADLLAALGGDLPEHLRFRNGLAPWERFCFVAPHCPTLDEEVKEAMRKRVPPPFVIA